ncbi:MAG TPA: biotin carboxylase N-terminal domain-containing protein, partial [Brevibacterium sp.]|nr:biotin carboxylase N-terminal domain-containing protein [Brevibacterium sp.]
GEIAIRAFPAAYELGAGTVAVFPYEDRNSLHRLKADEAYQIGEQGHPVRAYLSVEEIIAAARQAGADAIYPGYGFLSENPELARACEDAGITFVGPRADVLEMAGNKVQALAAARRSGVPTLDSTSPSADIDELLEQASAMEYPLFVKAVAGGGGRGMRRVDDYDGLVEALKAAMREAEGAFGDPTVFIEQAVQRPRHIEVQVLADEDSNAIHLFERDCSIQRRHQKVIEIAPAPNLDPEVAEALRNDALRFAREIGYQNAGTVEFLLETAGPRAGKHAFIEMNPRIQVEHTVTEEITDIDLVQSQMLVAAGGTLAELGLSQDMIQIKGAALQCRITTEDPTNSFRPDTGVITAYRSAGGAGVRLDGGTAYAGAEVSAHFDSMLVKCTTRGRSFEQAVDRARRALAEFRIRGVASNIGFLRAVLAEDRFRDGDLATSFIDDHPHLLDARVGADRGSKILEFLADVTVNRPNGDAPVTLDPIHKLAPLPQELVGGAAPAGSRQQLQELGPDGWARALREQ